MALTDSQKAKIRMYLGYPATSRAGNGSFLERAMNGLNEAEESIVVDALAKLASADSGLEDALEKQGLSRVEDVEFSGDQQLRAYRQQGRMYVQRVARILGCEVLIDAFTVSSGVATGGPLLRG